MIKKVLTVLFYLLFFLTPFLFFSFTSELFEFNKMMFVYLITIFVTFCWGLRMINERSFLFKRTPLDIPLLIFLISQIASTIFSIDPHTSIFGYYSRLNGGLLSTISYILLFYALVANFGKEDVIKFLKAALLGGLGVSLWAIPEHFGFSPSCLILTGEANASCWVQDVQARVFASLGQPNWLAAYLEMLLFPAVYFFLTAQLAKEKIFYAFMIICFYLAFTFTYSRGATIGLLSGIVLVALFYIYKFFRNAKNQKTQFSILLKLSGILLGIFIIINLLFGSALVRFTLFSSGNSKQQSTAQTPQPTGGTQLENGGTESGQIRLIVWKGALEIFKAYPLFGSGVETFAYSYYKFRPVEHNNTSEWDYLYNKAHNEFVNYLATTGLFGFLSYLAVIGIFIFYCLKKLIKLNGEQADSLFIVCILASYISYLVQNFFGFSVVIIALFFFLFPAITFMVQEDLGDLSEAKSKLNHNFSKVLHTSMYRVIFMTVLSLVTLVFLWNWLMIYFADTVYKKGSDYSDMGNAGKAYLYLSQAVSFNPHEPLYNSELAYAAASSALALDQDSKDNPENSKENTPAITALKTEADEETATVLKNHPNNPSYFRTAIRTYFQLTTIDRGYEDKALQAVDKAINLAPTDPKLLYNKALIIKQNHIISPVGTPTNEEITNARNQVIALLEKAVTLKPDYQQALLELADAYYQSGQKDKALTTYKQVHHYFPTDPTASDRINELETK